ncbi:hypothetical protein [Synechococcus sp. MIT S1220]|uniref:hypothetical protein n=1 Tax=Synechococcus sp. MIT S1220 TaxID=3082549 RepID=UPI0039B0A95D
MLKSLWKAALLVALLHTTVSAQTRSWQSFRDEFLGESKEQLQSFCQKGQQDNKQGLSLFNDVWVKQISQLRINAGVDPHSGSDDFFAGLAAAVRETCPEVW